MLFKEIIPVYTENHTEATNTKYTIKEGRYDVVDLVHG
jgi:hypothetical protein